MENTEEKLPKLEFDGLKLDAISFGDRTPTKTQIVNALDSICDFMQKMGAAVILASEYRIGSEEVGILFNAAIQVRGARDRFENGPNAAGLAVPQPGTRVPQNIR